MEERERIEEICASFNVPLRIFQRSESGDFLASTLNEEEYMNRRQAAMNSIWQSIHDRIAGNPENKRRLI